MITIGSAPHMRGILWARALPPAPTPRAPDQPRTCGEYRPPRRPGSGLAGSAPHMRGIRQPWDAGHVIDRISPTHAGNTRLKSGRVVGDPDQPRTCGEYQVRHGRRRGDPGSAPHMRGIRVRDEQRRLAARISPAHAGNTGAGVGSCLTSGDQPRTCGEYLTGYGFWVKRAGSAPHMRGIPAGHPDRDPPRRISPAHAGNTRSCPDARALDADQPRTCGEYVA